jgi:branched-chain amino acid transport system substrate-binding protein
MMMLRKKSLGLTLLAALMFAGICTNGGVSSASVSREEAAKGTPLVVGSIGSYSGAYAASLGGAVPALKAWASSVNASGGIDGHPVQMVIKDDAGSPVTALAAAKQLVQDHVTAIIGAYGTTATSWGEYVTKAGIPVIGGEVGNPPWGVDPLFFGVTQPSNLQVSAGVYTAKQLHLKKYAIMSCVEVDQCATDLKLGKTDSEAAGLDFVGSQAVSSSATDYTAPCLVFQSAGAQAVDMLNGAQQNINFAASCAKQGFKPVFLSGGDEATASSLNQPGLDGKYYVQSSPFPYNDKSIPATEAFHKAMQKYQPSATIESATAGAWADAEVYQAAALAAKFNGQPTSTALVKGIYSLPAKSTFGGLTGPLTFVKGQSLVTDCFFLMLAKGNTWQLPDGMKPTCPSTK